MVFERLPTQWFFDSVEMLFRYVRQELVDPLRNAVRFVGFGLLGGVFLLIGFTFASMGLLRLLQSFEPQIAVGLKPVYERSFVLVQSS